MKFRLHSTTQVLLAFFLWLGVFVPCSASAAQYQTILLASDKNLVGLAVTKLKPLLDIEPTGMEADYRSRVFITEEGTRIPFSKLFTGRSLQGSSALKTIAEEYRPDTLTLLWVDAYRVEEDKAYGLKKYFIRVRIRIVDVATGRNIVDKRLPYKSAFGDKVSGYTLREKAVGKLSVAGLRADFDRYYAAMPEKKRIKIVFRNIDQQDYFEKRDAFVNLVKEAGISADLRDTYDRAGQTFTLRSTLDSDFEAYYRTLYARATTLQTFDNFEIDKTGVTIFITELPPDRRRFIISGLTPDRYHDRLKTYRAALAGQSGVKDIQFRYLPGWAEATSRLVFTFTYSGDMARLEEGIWDRLSDAGLARNRKLVSITEKSIRIKSPLEEGDRVAVTVHFNNVAPGDYRQIGAALDGIVKDLSVRNLTKAYDRDGYRLTYHFDVNRTPVQMDTILWGKIAADESLGDIVQDATYGNTLAYFYQKKMPEEIYVRIAVKNLSPLDYRKAGRSLVALISAIEGVEKLDRTYSEDDQTLHITLHFKGKNAYFIDEAIWEGVKKDESLGKLAMGSVSRDELVYFFSGSSKRAGNIVVVLKGVSGQDYKMVSTSFSKLLGGISQVRNVRYAYYFDQRTIGFSIAYEGKSLFDFEDGLQKKMLESERFRYVLKGPEQPNRFVYFYKTEPLAVEKREGGEGQGYQATEMVGQSADISGRVSSLDRTVVVVLSYSAAGPVRGSGFLVNEDGYVLTSAKSIVQGRLVVRMVDGTQFQAQKVKTDPELGLALIKIISPGKRFQSVPIADSTRLNRGDKVFLIGAQQGQDYGHRTEAGIITGLDLQQDRMQVSMPASKITGGAPVFDAGGRVVAVMSGTAYPAAENRGLAIPIRHARALLQVVR